VTESQWICFRQSAHLCRPVCVRRQPFAITIKRHWCFPHIHVLNYPTCHSGVPLHLTPTCLTDTIPIYGSHWRPYIMASVALQSKDHRDLLDIIDRLRSKGISRYVDLPQIIVCGDQSAGKRKFAGPWECAPRTTTWSALNFDPCDPVLGSPWCRPRGYLRPVVSDQGQFVHEVRNRTSPSSRYHSRGQGIYQSWSREICR
jgi:hypothetical protein